MSNVNFPGYPGKAAIAKAHNPNMTEVRLSKAPAGAFLGVPKAPARQQIDAETWAESGGTAGMFGHLHRKGLLEIVHSEEQIIPKI